MGCLPALEASWQRHALKFGVNDHTTRAGASTRFHAAARPGQAPGRAMRAFRTTIPGGVTSRGRAAPMLPAAVPLATMRPATMIRATAGRASRAGMPGTAGLTDGHPDSVRPTDHGPRAAARSATATGIAAFAAARTDGVRRAAADGTRGTARRTRAPRRPAGPPRHSPRLASPRAPLPPVARVAVPRRSAPWLTRPGQGGSRRRRCAG